MSGWLCSQYWTLTSFCSIAPRLTKSLHIANDHGFSHLIVKLNSAVTIKAVRGRMDDDHPNGLLRKLCKKKVSLEQKQNTEGKTYQVNQG